MKIYLSLFIWSLNAACPSKAPVKDLRLIVLILQDSDLGGSCRGRLNHQSSWTKVYQTDLSTASGLRTSCKLSEKSFEPFGNSYGVNIMIMFVILIQKE